MKNYGFPLGIAALVTIIAVYVYGFGTGGTFQMAEHALRDALRTKSVAEQAPDDRIKIIAIDEESLNQLGPFPWPRSVYADMINNLMEAGAESVALDLLLIDPASDEQDDALLSEQLQRYPQVYLPVQVTLQSRQPDAESLLVERVDRPAASLHVREEQLGHVNVLPDPDGVIRHMTLGLRDENGELIPSLDVLLANRMLPEGERIRWEEEKQAWLRGDKPIPTDARHQVATDFFTSAYGYGESELNGYDRQSFIDVLTGVVDAEYYKDTTVLIGPYATSLSDKHMTPLSRTMTLHGVEIHANMVQSLLEGRFYKEAPFGWNVIALAAGIAAAAWCGNRVRGVLGAGCALLLAGLYTVIWIAVYETGSVFIPYFTEICGMTASYTLLLAYRSREERRARQQVEELFGRYVSPAVVTELLRSREPIRVGGTRCDITVMFIDIRGFTPLSERLAPEETIQVLNQYLHACADVIFRHQGTLDKFIGDGVMAIFGAPYPLERHEEHALQAALSLVKRAELLKQTLGAKDIAVQFGIGIQSGEAVVGNIGSEALRLDYTAIGDTVNTAARLESQAKPGQVLVGEETVRRLGSRFNMSEVGPLKLKGKSEPVLVYELLAEQEEA
ncbi:CHASE2 domain-containing protein [Paenibacillus dendritiformis]|uniref:Adenylate/guanylate cyclase with Chase sensor n=1 Tax=Paenibacillus dendritiformis C454 TaxID=1131935 RepID=H3SN13_9BACL|nr:adenylate/guanylate cyclase domain-containing protein [Paenibacillus dendritiformis]EHQ59544.1 adenylate/guanylate cyclase with Chase sensor [Paenibacillus dendritiformis C454]CAH8772065.1 adenylate/guanylate cyclase domain-containing protein [Paenibacillus dendritiformis]